MVAGFAKLNMKISPRLVFLATLYIFQLAKVANTEQCRKISSVHKSTTSIETNIRYGGHIWQHIGDLYQTPSSAYYGDTQMDKTLFMSESDFHNAWNNWRDMRSPVSTPRDCDGYALTYTDCVNAANVGINRAKSCVSVQSRICKQSTLFYPNSVIFVYKKGTYGWFLRTAYPSNKYCYN